MIIIPIPEFQDLMLPIVLLTGKQEYHKFEDIVSFFADYFELTDEERKKIMPECEKTVFEDRVEWALIFLIKAGLLRAVNLDVFHITLKGLEFCDNSPFTLDVKFLKKYSRSIKSACDLIEGQVKVETNPLNNNP